MTELMEALIECDYAIFVTLIYMYDGSGIFRMMLNRLYPMLSGEPGFYSKRYSNKNALLIFTQGAPRIMFISSRRKVKKILISFDFKFTKTYTLGFANKIVETKYRTILAKKIIKHLDNILERT